MSQTIDTALSETALPTCNLLVIRSPDIDRAVIFYKIIGLQFTKHSHGSGPEHYTSESCGFIFEIYPARSTSDATTATRIGFTVDSVDRVVKRLSELGATIRTKPSDSPWGRRAVVLDFDGHAIELCQSAKTSVKT